MRYEMRCLRCGGVVSQTYTRIKTDVVLVTTKCLNEKCKFATSFNIPIDLIARETPSLARKIEWYGCVVKT